jgi:Ca2+-binding RTX toxin-like protein
MSDVSYGVALGAPTRFSEPFPATILGGSGDDRLVGGNFADFISGGPGRDFLSGGDGDDTLEGDANSDTLGGNNGNDLLRGGAGDDRFIETDGDRAFGGDGVDIAGIDTVFESRATPPPQGSSIEAYGDVLDAALPRFDISRQGTLTIFGTRRSDVLHLEYFSEVSPIHYLLDVNGHSISIGAYPAKRIQIETGDGDDTMQLEEEVETTIHSAGATPIFVPVTMLGGNGNDSLIGGIGSDFLDGGAGDDFLAGSGGNDTLDGGDGNDTLHGDPGTDLLRNGESNLQGPDLTDFVVN